MMTFCPLRESSREGRRRLSWGSFEVQTRQWQASDGTPMDVPEPSTVTFMGAADIGKFYCIRLGEVGGVGSRRLTAGKSLRSKLRTLRNSGSKLQVAPSRRR